ncbi:MAG: alcohol dehydrogenase catalytic domain-containing protein [Planctomycetota bacterium]|jgi:L-iditol 2-dehydrogenase
MRAAVYYGPKDVRVEDVPDPVAAEGEVLLRVLRCAVCGTDKRIYLHGQKNVVPPAITGHEIVGEVIALGDGVEGPAPGTGVIVVTAVGCGRCVYCRREQYNLCEEFRALGYDFRGGFAEKMVVPARAVAQGNVIPLAEGISADRAALIEPLSCCLNGQEYLSPGEGERALVFGAGPIGLMHAGILTARKCDPVVVADVSAARLDYVKDFGIGLPVRTGEGDPVDAILAAAGPERFDVVITACSVKSVQDAALRLARKRARVSFFAGVPKDDPVLPIDTNNLHYNEISVFGAFASTVRHYHQAMEMVSAPGLPWDRFITHRFKLDEIVKAFDIIAGGQGIKVLIDCEGR